MLGLVYQKNFPLNEYKVGEILKLPNKKSQI